MNPLRKTNNDRIHSHQVFQDGDKIAEQASRMLFSNQVMNDPGFYVKAHVITDLPEDWTKENYRKQPGLINLARRYQAPIPNQSFPAGVKAIYNVLQAMAFEAEHNDDHFLVFDASKSPSSPLTWCFRSTRDTYAKPSTNWHTLTRTQFREFMWDKGVQAFMPEQYDGYQPKRSMNYDDYHIRVNTHEGYDPSFDPAEADYSHKNEKDWLYYVVKYFPNPLVQLANWAEGGANNTIQAVKDLYNKPKETIEQDIDTVAQEVSKVAGNTVKDVADGLGSGLGITDMWGTIKTVGTFALVGTGIYLGSEVYRNVTEGKEISLVEAMRERQRGT